MRAFLLAAATPKERVEGGGQMWGKFKAKAWRMEESSLLLRQT